MSRVQDLGLGISGLGATPRMENPMEKAEKEGENETETGIV